MNIKNYIKEFICGSKKIEDLENQLYQKDLELQEMDIQCGKLLKNTEQLTKDNVNLMNKIETYVDRESNYIELFSWCLNTIKTLKGKKNVDETKLNEIQYIINS
jgi:hypothetical protein